MSLHLLLMNLVNYSVQIAAVILAGTAAPLLLRVHRPMALLLYRQTLLIVCLLLPFLQSWNYPLIDSSVAVSMSAAAVTQAPVDARHWLNLDQIAATLLGAGMLARLCWLAAGYARLRRYRRRARSLATIRPIFDALQSRLNVWPSICVSKDVSSPVTFGTREPVILLPPEFLTMPPGAQEAIVCHELTHVRRRDWAVAMAQEFVRTLFWFHPAIWWLLGQIQLSREQAVDAEVIRITASREQYIDALLAVAGSHLQPDLAPAPLFLRKTHLAQRVALILKEVSMSKKRLLSSFAAISGALLITARFAVLYFPISAPAQEVVRGEANLRHRAPIAYPADAIEKGIQGTVVVEATLNDRGVVTEARVISGPEPLRKAAIQSVLDWHYGAQTQSPVEVAIDFRLPEKRPGPGGIPMMAPKQESGRLKSIRFTGITPALLDGVKSAVSVQIGDLVEPGSLARIRQAVREVDEHLDAKYSTITMPSGETEYLLHVFLNSPIDVPTTAAVPGRIRVGGNVQATQVISAPKPPYPSEAKQARIQGVVKLSVIIGKDGTVQDIKAISGHPILVPPSLEAVRQWIYKPTLLNGQPVEVETVVDVNYTLSQ